MKLDDLVQRLGGLDQKQFLARYPYPFLLEDTQDDPQVFLLLTAGSKPLVVGGGSRCHIKVRHETVSSKHAELLPPGKSGGSWRIVDASSTNGTFVDERAIEPATPTPLGFGTSIRFGPGSRFLFLAPGDLLERLPALEDLPPPPRDFSTERRTRSDIRRGAAETPSVVSLAPPPEGDLLLFCAPMDPVPLELDKTVVVGRCVDAADLVLPCNDVSRRHLECQRRAEGVFVRDPGSTNGTILRGLLLDTDWQLLPPGEQLEIGNWKLTVCGPEEDST